MLKIRILFYVSILVVFLLSIVNASNISVFNSLSFISDKFVHGAIYFYLTLLGLACSFKRSNYFVASCIFLFGALIGDSIPMNVSVGDTVVFGQYGGNEIKLNDEEYLILGEGDIFGVIE